MGVVLYVRTAVADGNAVTTDIQRAACRAWAEREQVTVVAEFEDGASGTNPDRPGLAALRAAARRGDIDGVFVATADRLAHHRADQTVLIMEFDRFGVAVYVAGADQGYSTATDRLPMASIAMLYHDQLVQRLAQERERARVMWHAGADPDIVRPMFTLYTTSGGDAPLSSAALAARLCRTDAFVVPLRIATYARAASVEDRVLQTATLRTAAVVAGWTVVRVAEDSSQGGGIMRPGLVAIRELARSDRIEVMLVVGLDRLTRSASELAALHDELAAAGCALVALANDPSASAADTMAA